MRGWFILVSIALLLSSAVHSKASTLLNTSLDSCIADALKDVENSNVQVISHIGLGRSGADDLTRALCGPLSDERSVQVFNDIVYVSADASNANMKNAICSFAIAGSAVCSVSIRDLEISLSRFIGNIRSILEPFVQSNSISSDEISRKIFFIVITDFDDSEYNEEYISETLVREVKKVWKNIGFNQMGSFENVFDLKFSFLPSKQENQELFNQEVNKLKLSFAALSPSPKFSIIERVRSMSSQISGQLCSHTAKERESISIVMDAFEKSLLNFQTNLSILKTSAVQAVDTNFGSNIDTLVESALSGFDSKAESASGTLIFGKKRAEFLNSMKQEAQSLYLLQLKLLRQEAAENFRKAPGTMRVSPMLSRDLNREMREADKFFAKGAEGLESKFIWSLVAFERGELHAELKNVANERLQLARIQGGAAALTKSRRQVGVSFHWLLPEPFGSDARQSPLLERDDAAFCSKRLKSNILFFDFSPFDLVEMPEGEATTTPRWEEVKKDAQKMVHRRSTSGK